MYRVFTSKITDPVTAALTFKPLGLTWRKGAHKDDKGVYGIYDMDYTGGYGPATKPVDGLIFQATQDRDLLPAILLTAQTNLTLRIPVKLRCGIQLLIAPATAEPQDFLFFGDETNKPELFRRNTEYGRAAWALVERHNHDGETVLQDDPLVINLAKLALRASYNLPLPVWDAFRLLSLDDVDNIALVALGVSEDFTEAAGSSSATPACGTEPVAC